LTPRVKYVSKYKGNRRVKHWMGSNWPEGNRRVKAFLSSFLSSSSAHCVPDGAAGALRGPLQPHDPLRAPHLLQLGAQTALQEHLLLLPAAHLQAEGGEAALRRRDPHHGHLQIHPRLQLRGVQLSGVLPPPRDSGDPLGLTGPDSEAVQRIERVDYIGSEDFPREGGGSRRSFVISGVIVRSNRRLPPSHRHWPAASGTRTEPPIPRAIMCIQSVQTMRSTFLLHTRPDATNCCSRGPRGDALHSLKASVIHNAHAHGPQYESSSRISVTAFCQLHKKRYIYIYINKLPLCNKTTRLVKDEAPHVADP